VELRHYSAVALNADGLKNNMNKSEIIGELKKAMEFYRELGFSYLPVREDDVAGLLSGISRKARQETRVLRKDERDENTRDKGGALNLLREEIGDCQRCKLSRGRTNIVFGEGSPQAELMFIGEGPGRDEDMQARPFVGAAGKLLTSLIEKLGMKREEVYIANIIKCRPPNNRDPEEDEISTCRQFIERQIEIIEPKVITVLGRVAGHALLQNKIPISRLRGNFFSYRDIPVMPTFHPAYLLRNPKDKWLTWDDMQKVLEKMGKTGVSKQ
jgi:DNA polymerase